MRTGTGKGSVSLFNVGVVGTSGLLQVLKDVFVVIVETLFLFLIGIIIFLALIGLENMVFLSLIHI